MELSSETAEAVENNLLSPGVSVDILSADLPMGHRLELLNEFGHLVVSLTKNLPGNSPEEKSYTLALSGGHKILLPVPYLFEINGLSVFIQEDEDVKFRLHSLSTITSYKLVENKAAAGLFMSPKIVEKCELSPEWQEVPLADDQCLVFEGEKDGRSLVLARLFKVPKCDEFILRAPGGELKQKYVEGDNDGFQAASGGKIFFEVRSGKFYLKGDARCALSVE